MAACNRALDWMKKHKTSYHKRETSSCANLLFSNCLAGESMMAFTCIIAIWNAFLFCRHVMAVVSREPRMKRINDHWPWECILSPEAYHLCLPGHDACKSILTLAVQHHLNKRHCDLLPTEHKILGKPIVYYSWISSFVCCLYLPCLQILLSRVMKPFWLHHVNKMSSSWTVWTKAVY